MFVRLTARKRTKAGWFIALLYLFCVLAPGISFAFSNGSRAAACFTDENHGLGIVQVHELSEASAPHAQKYGHVHGHSTTHAHFGQSDGHIDPVYAADEAPDPASGSHKTSGAQCCGMVCLSALPATITEIVNPSAPTSVCASENYRNVADNAPPAALSAPHRVT